MRPGRKQLVGRKYIVEEGLSAARRPLACPLRFLLPKALLLPCLDAAIPDQLGD